QGIRPLGVGKLCSALAALTREGLGHAGVILFRRSISLVALGKQARLLAEFWQEAADWDWADRIEHLPGL
ncbi:MAG: hypothetical protein NTW03_10400, partial [Verrucomicrobia bacterium]|nr:hypothetical protein [Verrucomicrobiota bacterium]